MHKMSKQGLDCWKTIHNSCNSAINHPYPRLISIEDSVPAHLSQITDRSYPTDLNHSCL